LGSPKGVVSKYVGKAAAGLDWNAIAPMSETALERHDVYSRLDRPTHYALPEYGRIHQELRRKGMILMLLWEEYVAAHPEQSTYRYSQFCERYRRYAMCLKRSMRQIHRAGKMFVDYAGPTVELIDGSRAHIFVAALGASSYTSYGGDGSQQAQGEQSAAAHFARLRSSFMRWPTFNGKSLPGSKSASEKPSRCAKKSCRAPPSTPARLQWPVRTHRLPLPKHSTSAKSGSMPRTTAPRLISCGTWAKRMPPPLPRTVLIQPCRPSWCVTFIRWASEMS
jgi:hypothetical protein